LETEMSDQTLGAGGVQPTTLEEWRDMALGLIAKNIHLGGQLYDANHRMSVMWAALSGARLSQNVRDVLALESDGTETSLAYTERLAGIAEHLDKKNVSDGYHTFGELYEHRHHLFLLALEEVRKYLPTFKTKKNKEGEEWDGWFIAGFFLADGRQVSYHLPVKYWDRVGVLEIERNVEYDGHNAMDVLERLEYLTAEVCK
jgi:hypothetical protein